MSDVTDTDIQPADTNPGAEDVDQPDTPEGDNPEVLPGAAEKADDADTFPREVVEELRRVVRAVVAASPVAVEDGVELRDHVWVARRRCPHVPFDARDLSGVRQVGRPDVRRGKP